MIDNLKPFTKEFIINVPNRNRFSRKPVKSGFTLADMLIALGLLGIIVSYSMPKILLAVGKREVISKTQETVAVLEEVWYSLKQQQAYVPRESLYFSLFNSGSPVSLNVIEKGPDQLTGTGCDSETWGYVILPNNVAVTGLRTFPFPNDLSMADNGLGNSLICIDVNGRNKPNSLGKDTFYGVFNPTGDFDEQRSVLTYNGGINAKNFLWGNVQGFSASSTPSGTAIVNTPAFSIGQFLR